MELLNRFCLIFLSNYCCEEFFIKFNFLHVDCLKAAISKVLGLAIVAGSMLVKIPQIIKILNAKSGHGISVVGTTMELFAMLSNVSYSYLNKFPFSSYGDGFFLLIQTSIIGAFVLHYEGASQKAVAFVMVIAATFLGLCSGLVPIGIVWSLQASNIPLVFAAKMIQAWTNYQNSSTGQLSAITVTMLFMGSTARIFTSIQETGDSLIILNYCVATLANAVLMAQLILYWNSAKSSKKMDKKKKK